MGGAIRAIRDSPDTSKEHITIRGLNGEVLRVYEGTERADRKWKEDTIYRDGQPLIRIQDGGQGTQKLHALHHDHLGSVRQVTNWLGEEVSRHRYYPFGKEATPVAASDPNHKFTGHERDEGFQSGEPLDYMHARNNPLRYVDPDGMKPRSNIRPPKSAEERAKANAEFREKAARVLGDVPVFGGLLAWGAEVVLSTVAPATAEEMNAAMIGMVGPGGGPGGKVRLRAGGSAADSAKGKTLGELISRGHAFDTHIDDFVDLGIESADDLARHVDGIVSYAADNNIQRLSRGRTAYWDELSETVVIHDPGAVDLGTVFRPRRGRDYFDGLE